MKVTGDGGRRRGAPGALALAVPLLAFAFLALHFFELFPGGWDQAEYAWCLRGGYLPHSPYLVFLALGHVMHLLAPPPLALSLLSFGAGLGSLGLLAALVRKLAPASAVEPVLGVLLLGSSFLFVRQAGTQEVYLVLLGFVLASAVAVAPLVLPRPDGTERPLWRRPAAGGVLFGLAVGTHGAALFALPAVTFLLLRRNPGSTSAGPAQVRRMAIWSTAACATLALMALPVILLYPAPGPSRLAGALGYLRGLSPGLHAGRFLDGNFLLASGGGLLHRLLSAEIPVSGRPLATSPVGLGWLNLGLSLAGLGLARWRDRRGLLFWPLLAGPYLIYELGLGINLDAGLYAVFVLPATSALCAAALGELWQGLARAGSRPRTMAVVLVTLGLLLPSLLLFARRWSATEEAWAAHLSPPTLAALWAAENLPSNAILIQARGEWNVNTLPYYSRRRHVLRWRRQLSLFQDRGRLTPMNDTAYAPLTTLRLSSLLQAGVPVYAFDPHPLSGFNPEVLDPAAFAWDPGHHIDTGAVAAGLALPPRVRAQLDLPPVTLYRAQLRLPALSRRWRPGSDRPGDGLD